MDEIIMAVELVHISKRISKKENISNDKTNDHHRY